MLDRLVQIDTDLFLFLNVRLANGIFDFIMPVATNDWFLRALFLIAIAYLVIFGKKHGRITALLCLVTIVLTDQLTSHVLKPLAGRVRPCHILSGVHLLVNCSQGLSFPSSHAANSMAQALILSYAYRRQSAIFLAIAIVVCYSRIAVGVHYPADVIAGGLLGMICGYAVYSTHRLVINKLDPADQPPGISEKTN